MDETEKNLDTVYNPKDFEDKIYDLWMDSKAYLPVDSDKKFVMVIPPPNVTSHLHLGHALNISLQDILLRYYKLKGYSALWMFGTDHAGIATQSVVEKKLLSQGTSRKEIGRQEFIKRTWEVKEQHHQQITNQTKKMGALVDWSRERFTLDEGLNKSVLDIFEKLYKDGLIYKGTYLVNWSIGAQTAISDDEVEYKDINGFMYHIKYPIKDTGETLEIATSRPETMLGDTALAVNPNDDRYKHLIGKYAILPLVDKMIPIIADEYVDMTFGTGALKITPGHDPNDYELGKKYNLEIITVLDKDGKITNAPSKYVGLDRFVARQKIVEDLEQIGLFVKKEKHKHSVGHCYRSGTIIEPLVSAQWFVKMKPLAQKALQLSADGKVNFFPKRWENFYANWLNNIRDWCISRQLWWGHRIPVYYCKDCNHEFVSTVSPSQCSRCNSENIYQDEDVLDTWFSSWLWPFSVFGYPEQTDDFKKYFPTTTLITAYDIIFFWVARMIMASGYLFDKAPFKDIYITPLIRDKKGEKMSKSKGNGIDPLVIIDKYGSDALRFTFAYLSVMGQDINIGEDSFLFGGKFVNKIYNASRFLMLNADDISDDYDKNLLNTEDRWIISRYENAILEMSKNIEIYRYQDASKVVYDYFWKDFCDWYIEIKKPFLNNPQTKPQASKLMISLLKKSFILLHPFVPFITEHLYQKLSGDNSILINQRLSCVKENIDTELENKFSVLQNLISSIRTIKSEFNLKLSSKINITLNPKIHKDFIKENQSVITTLIQTQTLSFDEIAKEYLLIGIDGVDIGLDVKGDIDFVKMREKFEKEKAKLCKKLDEVNTILGNTEFMQHAKPEVIEQNQDEHKTISDRLCQLDNYISQIS